MKKKLVLASGNKHKIKEFTEILTDYEIIPMRDLGFQEDIEENGTTLLENSLIKVKQIRKYLNSMGLDYPVVADDSGLFCEGLDLRPGVYSARYGGVHGDDEANRQRVLKELENSNSRRAYFGAIIVILMADGTYYVGDGKTYGEILKEYKGDTSFGYDCIFYSTDLNKSFGEASAEEKNSVSHRARALRDLLDNIRNGKGEKVND